MARSLIRANEKKRTAVGFVKVRGGMRDRRGKKVKGGARE
jgi:hypothetical protein